MDAEVFGDPSTDKNDNVLRISFQNISSLPSTKMHYKNGQLLNFVKKRGIDVYLMAEIGLHWPSVPQDQGWEERLFGHFRIMPKGIMACNTTEPQLSGPLQYGGTGTLVTDDAAHQAKKHGKDPTGLGRWCWSLLEGKRGIKVRLISAYPPCTSQGHKSVFQQHRQYFLLRNQDIDPRQQMLDDLYIELS